MTHSRHGAPDIGHDVDNGTALLVHALHKALARHQEATGQVGVDDRLPAFGADRLQRRHVLATRVVHQTINMPMTLDHGAHRLLDHFFLADVANMETGSTAVLRDLVHHRLQGFGLAPEQHGVRTERRQLVCNAAPDAGAATRDQHHLAGKQAARKYRTVSHQDSFKNKAMAASVS